MEPWYRSNDVFGVHLRSTVPPILWTKPAWAPWPQEWFNGELKDESIFNEIPKDHRTWAAVLRQCGASTAAVPRDPAVSGRRRSRQPGPTVQLGRNPVRCSWPGAMRWSVVFFVWGGLG